MGMGVGETISIPISFLPLEIRRTEIFGTTTNSGGELTGTAAQAVHRTRGLDDDSLS